MSHQIYCFGAQHFEVEIDLGNGRRIVDNGTTRDEAMRRAIERLVNYIHLLETELAEDMIYLPHPNEAHL